MTTENMIVGYFHCGRCLEDLEENQTYTPRLAVGMCPDGIQVWCEHHDMNVAVITPERLQQMMAQPCQCAECGDPA